VHEEPAGIKAVWDDMTWPHSQPSGILGNDKCGSKLGRRVSCRFFQWVEFCFLASSHLSSCEFSNAKTQGAVVDAGALGVTGWTRSQSQNPVR
jgi:hypothetical protein